MEVLLFAAVPPVPHTSPYSGRRWPRHGGFEPLRTRRRRQRAEPKTTTTTTTTTTTCTALRHRRRQPQQTTRDEVADRIREQLRASSSTEQPAAAAETVSSYDTAWVAMVPAPGAPGSPRFPRYLEWIMQNQHEDGSWGLGGHLRLPSLGKDAIASTLACVLALRTWGIGDEHVSKGDRAPAEGG